MKLTSSLVALASICLGLAPGLVAQTLSDKPQLKGYFAYKAAGQRDAEALRNVNPDLSNVQGLPLWNYTWQSSRDGNVYTGTMVGTDPFSQRNSTSVPTYVVPLILQLNRVATAIDPKTGTITTKAGTTIFSSSAPDTACLSAPNNVPATLLEQSPVLQKANFYFGNTPVGNTQYVDAFQRANFWHEIGSTLYSTYHVTLAPHMLSPVFINVPAQYGTAISFAGACAPLGYVNIAWFDALISTQVLPALHVFGVTTSAFPIFLVHNLVWGDNNTNINQCCVLGYHGWANTPVQTYSPVDFDNTGLFGSAVRDTVTVSHEVAEWMNDPFGFNFVPAWGNVGQVAGCQDNLEVGDPLTGSLGPSVVMPNGYTYHLQELAFFSWFMGAPSLGLHNWFSDNASFTQDAGGPCVSSASAAASPTNQSHLVIVR